ncbi:MAG: hypothetical protein R2939_02445 [Kofleriaceae bacterium]
MANSSVPTRSRLIWALVPALLRRRRPTSPAPADAPRLTAGGLVRSPSPAGGVRVVAADLGPAPSAGGSGSIRVADDARPRPRRSGTDVDLLLRARPTGTGVDLRRAAADAPGATPAAAPSVEATTPHPPRGDARSMRRSDTAEFALVSRVGATLICHTGATGTDGDVRVVDYPTPGAAGLAYARECSRLIALGFADASR